MAQSSALQETRQLHCPYCGEIISVLVDLTAPSQRYIEDCEVCCRPIELEQVMEPGGEVELIARRDDD